MTLVYVFLAALLVSLVPLLWIGGRARFRHRGTRVVTCPDTRIPAAVRVDGVHAALSMAFGEPDVRIAGCSLWPEREACARDCLSQIVPDPRECLPRTMLVDSSRGAPCDLCGKEVGPVHWIEHKPALMTPDRPTVEWDEAEAGPGGSTPPTTVHRLLCWGCHAANALRERFPGFTAPLA